MKSQARLLTFLAVGVVALITYCGAGAQALLLPSPAGFVQGRGECSDLTAGIASPTWRVRKGDVFEVWVVHPIALDNPPTYAWKVANGKIVSGQGTLKIAIEAGKAKTDGYLNATVVAGLYTQ